MEEKKKELQKILVNSLELQRKVKVLFSSNPPNLVDDVKNILGQLKECSKQSSKLCDELQHDHGKALTSMLNCFIDWNELILKYVNNSNSNNTKEILKEESEPIEKRLFDIRKIAQSFKDASLDARAMELLANIYSKTNQIDKEINILERAVAMEKTPPRSIALFDSYLRKLEFTYQDRDRIYQLNNKDKENQSQQPKQQQQQPQPNEPKPDDDNGFMKLHADAWEIYLWLKSMPGFPRDQFLLQRKASMFKLCIYIGSLANPLISAKDKDIVSIAMEAFDEALHLADITQNKEYFCAATAHKSSVVYRTLPEDERDKLLKSLKEVEERMKPENSEIRDLINSIENKNPSLHPELKEKEDKEKQEKEQQEKEQK
ncbi:hypothetical protein DICPUDRAFT_42738 [Dictyostelium purpureum]|uniref:Uncharacterized protein n=1 Tax=Dictyostelium purpureum TaxID=5786 RepID=F1A2P6_DICPU|nr:uncharacterized protein DICPUDRAFT_42738 [Dictyostelium purpureum]EGC29534.1 hypothetical protein DICPUDRAFT_42738 [Dictyostelium purpureum]|eukprot:XP_003293942.1 hypothetical protein DICPUDRAFT_42738 [Dictyostelium purpureum]